MDNLLILGTTLFFLIIFLAVIEDVFHFIKYKLLRKIIKKKFNLLFNNFKTGKKKK